jgi:hypothetical protein
VSLHPSISPQTEGDISKDASRAAFARLLALLAPIATSILTEGYSEAIAWGRFMHASQNDSDTAAIERAREHLQAALKQATGEGARRALAASLRILDDATSSPAAEHPSSHAGSIDYTFDDEAYEPHGRQVEARVFYRWEDYNQEDQTPATWGATIEGLQVLTVRYFDEDGEEVTPREHHQDLAWDLLEQHREQVTEACTDDGYRRGLGVAPPSYVPLSGASDSASPSAAGFAVRMAPSEPTRQAQHSRRWG